MSATVAASDAAPPPATAADAPSDRSPAHYRGRHLAKPKPPSTVRSLVEWTFILVGALVLALLVRTFVFTTYWIPSPSMEPTLIGDVNGGGRHDRVIVNRLSYDFHAVHRGDIVVFKTPKSLHPVTEDGHPIAVLIKRVVGLPGDHVVIRDGHVDVGGHVLVEPYLRPSVRTYQIPVSECADSQVDFHIPKGSVLVLGDNRGNSEDGRCFGPIKESSIVGRAFIRIWPLGHINWL